MASLAPRLPLTIDSGDGYTSIKSLKALVKQNFKMLILTNPGERVMEPEFGVGLRNFLFDPRQATISNVRQRIQNQITKYMPFIRNLRINFDRNKSEDILADSNILSLTIIYDVPSLNISSELLAIKEELS